MSHILLKLYIAGMTARSARVIANLRRICEKQLGGNSNVVIIDILEQPQLAEEEKILATPTLIKILPTPACRIIGDLADAEQVLLGLNL